MIRHRDGGTRRGDAGSLPSTVPELARTLRRARTRQGLRVEDVSARTGLLLDQIHALEAGVVDRLPDRVVTLKTLRRYADFLGLPGERLVLAVLDRWPTPPGTPVAPAAQPVPGDPGGGGGPGGGVGSGGSGPAGAPAAGGSAPASMATRVLAAGHRLSGWGPAPGDAVATPVVPAAQVPPILPGPLVTPGAPTAGPVPVSPVQATAATPMTSQVPAQPRVVDTGVIPAFQPPAPPAGPRHRAARTPLALRILVVLVALAVLAGVAGLLAHRYEPHWLVDLGITHDQHPGAGAGGGTGSATATSTTAAGGGGTAGHGTGSSGTSSGLRVTASTPGSATLAVQASSFTVVVGAVGAPSWVDATLAGSTTPSFSGILAAGQSKTFTVPSGLTVVVGSVAAHAYVSVGGHTVGYYSPPAAPYTMTFRAAS